MAATRRFQRIEGEGLVLQVQRTVEATALDTFAAFTAPKLLREWFGGTVVAQAKVGGRFRYGDLGRGAFTQIEQGSLLRMAWETEPAEGSEVEVTIETVGGGTSVVRLRHRGLPSQEALDEMKRRWTAALDGLKHLLASGNA